MFGYECLYSKSPRSFLFSVVANVGPRGASRSLAVAYRQGNDKDISVSSSERVENVVADILALIKIFSDPANRAPLEAERALAEGWYGRSQGENEAESNERPSVPDRPQPPFVIPDGSQEEEQSQIQPELPWHDDGLSEFPFTTTCLLLALLRNDSDSNATNSISTRPGDVQLQPLSTLFRADCLEYGLVVLDISDLDSGVKYGIVGFPVRYMAEVSYWCETGGWDPVEDPPPEKEPDTVLASPRPRVPLAISPWLRKYFYHMNLEEDPRFLILKNTPIVYAASLDYIWPPELENQPRGEDQAGESSPGVISSISNYFWPSKSTTSAKDASTTTPSRLTTSNEPPRNAHMDRAIDNLLILTQDPADLHLDEETIDKFQKLAEFREQLRRRLAQDLVHPKNIEAEKIIGDVLSALQEVAEDHRRGAQRQLEIQENAVKQKLSDKEEECLQSFRLTSATKDTTYEWYKDRVETRVEGTCEWFLSHDNFQKWSQGESGLLLVSADPGCGKSVLAKYLIDNRLPCSATLCYFFFQDQDQNTVHQALCAIFHQLFSQRPNLIKHAMEKYRKNGRGMTESTNSLWAILEDAVQDPQAGPVIIVLDTLDECAESEFEDLIQGVERHVRNNHSDQSKLKYLLTSRPYEQIECNFVGLLESFPFVRIPGEEESESISREVSHFIRNRIEQLAKEKRLSDPVKSHLARRLLEVPHRTYLWVYLVFDHLSKEHFKKTAHGVDSTIQHLPTDVYETYERILGKSKKNPEVRRA